MSENNKKKQLISRRAFLIGCGKLLLSSILLSRFAHIQLVQGKKYHTLSKNNKTRIQVIPQARGVIFDRNQQILADNYLYYSANLNPLFFPQAVEIINEVERILQKTIQLSEQPNLHKLLRASLKYRVPVILHAGLTWSEVIKLETSMSLNNKIEILSLFQRQYRYGSQLSHVLGYVSKPSIGELRDSNINQAYANIEVGKNGLELIFDSVLRGEPDIKQVEVNAAGHIIREIALQPGAIPEGICTAIDLNVQKIVSQCMQNKSGVVVLMKIDTGEVISMLSSPSYDANNFIPNISLQDWNKLLHDPSKPLINKAICGLYPPGSTFKPVTALAILDKGINPTEEVFCNGKYVIGNREVHCWRSDGHGQVNLSKALSQSCNIYFYIQGQKAGISSISNIAKICGLGKKTGIELPHEYGGLIPDPAWKLSKFKTSWRLGDTINSSIGQGYINATPLQMVTMIARIASGKMVSPTLIKKLARESTLMQMKAAQERDIFSVYDDEQRQTYLNASRIAPIFDNMPCQSAHLRLLHQGMRNMFQPGGTGFGKHPDSIKCKMAGKTGSAQVVSQRKVTTLAKQEHGLFVGFFPYDAPKYAISVVVEHGGWGGASALPIAVDIAQSIS